ncbi:hypothetical protein CYY_000376 [Polysphondylium violaceum]|uniref:Uncharacterized protein n=1 Tax=Polysphondylium violaceum TaxID=133409 RepID=A0A8J4VBK5_9MYCE|nr:hypothetical protein CYY_000376 [Polysphondylium violaceum]
MTLSATSPVDGPMTFELDHYSCNSTPVFDISKTINLVKFNDQHNSYLKILSPLKLFLNSKFSVSCQSQDFTLKGYSQINLQLIKLEFTPNAFTSTTTLKDNIQCTLLASPDVSKSFDVNLGYQKGSFDGSFSLTHGHTVTDLYYSSFINITNNINSNQVLIKANDNIYWRPHTREGNNTHSVIYTYNNTKGYHLNEVKSDFIIVADPIISTDISTFTSNSLLYPNIISDDSEFTDSSVNSKIVYLKLDYTTDYIYADYLLNVEFSKGYFTSKDYLIYPRGFESGTLANYKISFNYPCFKYIKTIDVQVYGNQVKTISTPPVPPSVFDSPIATPTFVKQINSTASIYRVVFKDIVSGFNRIISNDGKIIASSQQLISGDENNGVFEFIYTGSSKKITAVNNLGLTRIIDLPNFIEPSKNSPLSSNFLSIQFEQNNIDLSNVKEPIKNKATITFNQPFSTMVSLSFYTFTSYYERSSTFYATSAMAGTFVIDFEILPNRWSGFLEYTLQAGDLVLNSDTLCALNPSFGLKVSSSYADYVPPIVSELSHFPSSLVDIPDPTPSSLETFIDLAFNITIKDEYNGLKNGSIWIASDLDPIGFNFTIYPNMSLNNNPYRSKFTLPFKVSTRCKSQEYYIKDIKLFDNSNSISSTYFPYMNPFFDQDLNLKLSIVCGYPQDDQNPPYLTSFKIFNDTQVDVSKLNRQIFIQFNVKDDGSGLDYRRTPLVYASEVNFNNIVVVSELVDKSTGLYRASLNLPYGFGLFGDIHFSIYGLMDNQMNFKGYSTLDLKSGGFDYYVKTKTTFSPIITNNQAVLMNGYYYITIQGLNFGTTNTTVQSTSSMTDDSSFTNIQPGINDFTTNSFICFTMNPYLLPLRFRVKKSDVLFSNDIFYSAIMDPTTTPVIPITTGSSTTSAPSGTTTGTDGTPPVDQDSSSIPNSTKAPQKSSNSNKLSGGQIAGIVIGVIALAGIVGTAVYFKSFKKSGQSNIKMSDLNTNFTNL